MRSVYTKAIDRNIQNFQPVLGKHTIEYEIFSLEKPTEENIDGQDQPKEKDGPQCGYDNYISQKQRMYKPIQMKEY